MGSANRYFIKFENRSNKRTPKFRTEFLLLRKVFVLKLEINFTMRYKKMKKENEVPLRTAIMILSARPTVRTCLCTYSIDCV